MFEPYSGNKNSPMNGGDDNAWKLYTFSCCFISSRNLDISTSPNHLSLGKVATGLASVDNDLNEWREIKGRLLKEEK